MYFLRKTAKLEFNLNQQSWTLKILTISDHNKQESLKSPRVKNSTILQTHKFLEPFKYQNMNVKIHCLTKLSWGWSKRLPSKRSKKVKK